MSLHHIGSMKSLLWLSFSLSFESVANLKYILVCGQNDNFNIWIHANKRRKKKTFDTFISSDLIRQQIKEKVISSLISFILYQWATMKKYGIKWSTKIWNKSARVDYVIVTDYHGLVPKSFILIISIFWSGITFSNFRIF